MKARGMSRRDLLRATGAVTLASPLAGGLLAGCGEDAVSSGGALKQLKRVGVARLAIANEPPYTKVDTDGTVTGAAPEVARAVLERMGIPKVEGLVTPYDAMIPGLKARRWDIITAGLFMKKSRCSQVLYSDPVLVSTESFAVEPGNPLNLSSLADVKENSNVKLGILKGAYEAGLVEDAGVPSSQTVNVPDARSGIEALSSGRVDAFFLPTLSLNSLKETSADFEVTEPLADVPVTGDGAAFRRSDKDLRDAFNAEYRKIKKSGELAKILDPWGFSAEEAKKVTTKQLCKNEG